jgi:hypothetical protein
MGSESLIFKRLQPSAPSTPPSLDRIQPFYDFNGDGASDTVIRGQLEEVTNAAGVKEKVFIAKADGQLQGIFFDGQQDNGEAPDLVRIIDQEVRQQPVGILTSISTADLRNTDILFFRESTGQLVMEHINGVRVFDFYSLAVILLSLDLHER